MLQIENGFYLILIIFKYENYTVLQKRNEQVWARPLCAVTDKNREIVFTKFNFHWIKRPPESAPLSVIWATGMDFRPVVLL